MPHGFDLYQVWCSYNIMNGTVYSSPLQSDADILNQLSSHTVHVLSCASSVMRLIAEIGESLKYACMNSYISPRLSHSYHSNVLCENLPEKHMY